MNDNQKNILESYEFKSQEEFFNYVLESFINGQMMQVRNLYRTVKKHFSLTAFVDYLNEFDSDHVKELKDYLLKV